MTDRTGRPAPPPPTWGTYVRAPVGVRPPCRIETSGSGRFRITTVSPDGHEETVLDVPVEEIDSATLRVGQVTVRTGGRTYDVSIANLSGTSVAGVGGGLAMARLEKAADPVGLAWLRWFADHGVTVEAPARWKPRVRFMVLGLAVLVSVLAVLTSVIGIAEAGGWTGDARFGVLGTGVLAGLAWTLFGVTSLLLRRTYARDTARRLGLVRGR